MEKSVIIYAFRSPGSGAVYIGKHECDPTGWPRRGNGRLPDGYKGSGKVVPHFHARHGDRVEWRILAVVPLADWPRAEKRAVDLARAILGRRCVNRAPGGAGLGSDLAREVARRLWADDKLATKTRDASRAIWERPEVRQRHRDALVAIWSDPETRAKRSLANGKANSREEVREKHRANSRALWDDPNYAGRTAAAIAAAQRTPDARAMRIAEGRARVQTPEGAAAIARARAAGSAPEVRARAATTARINDGWRRWALDNPHLVEADP